MNFLRELWGLVLEAGNLGSDLYDTGTFWIRAVLALIFGWFLVLVATALIPVPAAPSVLAILPLLLILIPLFAAPIIFILVASVPQTRGVVQALAGIVAVQLTLGLYFAAVPVYTDRTLALLVLGAMAAYSLYAIAWRVPFKPGKIMGLLFIFIIAATIIFFFGGRQKVQQQIAAKQVAPPAVSQPREEQFSCGPADKDGALTALVGPGTIHRIWATQPWKARDGATGTVYDMPAGYSSWLGGAPEGLLRAWCSHEGTKLKFQKVR